MPAPRIALGPDDAPGWVRDAIVAGGGEIVAGADAEALVWMRPTGVDDLRAALAAAPAARWVQLPWAGVEGYAGTGLFDDGRTWTCGKGVYAEPVAEHALALGLAGLRRLVTYGRRDVWSRPAGTSLYDARVTILGGGGITEALVGLLAPFRADVTVVRRSTRPMPGVDRVLTADHLDEALPGADLVVLALALTPSTRGVIAASQLRLMEHHAWLVNVARGAHVVTGDLVTALEEGWIGGAALDVTDPEPLPADHRLWRLENCLITPHTANTPEMARGPLSARITENVRRFASGAPLLGLVDPASGY